MGVRRPPQRRLHAQVRLDQDRPTPDRQGTERHPTTPPWPTTGPGDDARRPCRSTRPPRGSPTPRTVAARSAAARCSPSRTSHKPRASGRQWLATTRTTIITIATRRPARSDEAEPRLIHADCRNGQRPGTSAPPTSHQGLLEPDAGKLARPVLRGARRSNAPGLPGASANVGGVAAPNNVAVTAEAPYPSWPQPVSAPPLTLRIVSSRPGAVERRP